MSLVNWLSDNNIKILNEYSEFKNVNNKNPDKILHSLFSLFQVDLKREIQNQFIFLKHSNLQPSEIKEMYYWEWQMMLEELHDYIEKEKEEREKEEGKHAVGSYKDSKEYKDAKSSMPNFNTSSFKMPNF